MGKSGKKDGGGKARNKDAAPDPAEAPAARKPFDGAVSRFVAHDAPSEIRDQLREAGKNTILDARYPYSERMSAEDYEADDKLCQLELIKAQSWMRGTGQRIVVVFEGRDAAGKGGTIKAVTENLNPRYARVVALAAPDETERGQWYFQRYVQHLPSSGEIAFFDRSWYNRAGVEHVMGFCNDEEYSLFFRQAPGFERSLTQSGVHLFKLWFTVSAREQRRRFEARSEDPLKQWKISPMDAEAVKRYAKYGQARDTMLAGTDHADAPWTIVNSNEKKRARLESIRHVLSSLDYDHKDKDVARHADPVVVQPAAAVISR
jgi:polyphosphate kinase